MTATLTPRATSDRRGGDTRSVASGPAMTAPPVLSPREWEVVQRFALGQTYEQIAAGLGVTRATVNSHRQRVSEKCGGGSLLDVLRAIGWLRIPPSVRHLAYTAPPAWRQG